MNYRDYDNWKTTDPNYTEMSQQESDAYSDAGGTDPDLCARQYEMLEVLRRLTVIERDVETWSAWLVEEQYVLAILAKYANHVRSIRHEELLTWLVDGIEDELQALVHDIYDHWRHLVGAEDMDWCQFDQIEDAQELLDNAPSCLGDIK